MAKTQAEPKFSTFSQYFLDDDEGNLSDQKNSAKEMSPLLEIKMKEEKKAKKFGHKFTSEVVYVEKSFDIKSQRDTEPR